MPAASVPKEAAFVAPLRGVRPCKETGQLLRGAGGRRGGVLMKTVECSATAEKVKPYQIPDRSLVQEEGQWAPGPRNLSRAQ